MAAYPVGTYYFRVRARKVVGLVTYHAQAYLTYAVTVGPAWGDAPAINHTYTFSTLPPGGQTLLIELTATLDGAATKWQAITATVVPGPGYYYWTDLGDASWTVGAPTLNYGDEYLANVNYETGGTRYGLYCPDLPVSCSNLATKEFAIAMAVAL